MSEIFVKLCYVVFTKMRQLVNDNVVQCVYSDGEQAEDFSEAVEAVNEWLPLAEAELKFRALPDEEDGLMRWIENHDVSYFTVFS